MQRRQMSNTSSSDCGTSAKPTLFSCYRIPGTPSSESLQEGISGTFPADRGIGPMAGNHHGRIPQRQQLVMDGPQDLLVISARQIRAADTVEEEGIAREQLVLLGNP